MKTQKNRKNKMSKDFTPQDENFRSRVQNSFDRQQCMTSLNITMSKIEPGKIELSMPFNQLYTQQHGFIHAGIITTALDSACGYAAFTLMDPNAAVLTVEFKTNLLSPAKGEIFQFEANVIKPGRTITVAEAKAFALQGEEKKLIASMTGTLMALSERTDIKH